MNRGTPKLSGNVAIVTGAAGAGIGRAVAYGLAKEGASVTLSDASAKRLSKAEEEMQQQFQDRILAIECDVSNRNQVENMVKQTLNKFGKVDILVNNAGITKVCPVHEMTDDAWDIVLNVNLKGTFYCTRAVLPHMMEQRYGRIVNISSIDVWVGRPNNTHYRAAKSGIIGFTRGVAGEVARYNVTVNAIAPGLIWNEFLVKSYPKEIIDEYIAATPVGRAGQPEDVANAILFLVSPESSYITGDVISVSGGIFMY